VSAGAPDRRWLEENVRLAIAQLGPLSGLDFGLDRESLRYVEGFLERQRERPGFDPDAAGGLIGVVGAFLGACVAEATGGEWHWSEERGAWCVRLPNGALAFPFAKVNKLARQGLAAGESIVSFYDIAVKYLATGALSEAARRDGTGAP